MFVGPEAVFSACIAGPATMARQSFHSSELAQGTVTLASLTLTLSIELLLV